MTAYALLALIATTLGVFFRAPVDPTFLPITIVATSLVSWWVFGFRLVLTAGFFLWAVLDGHRYLQGVPPPELLGEDLLVAGCVASLPRESPHAERFTLNISRLADNRVRQLKIQLSDFDDDRSFLPGQCWELLVRLKPPHGLRNPGQFDRIAWLYRSRVRATGYVRDSALNRQLVELAGSSLLQFRFRVLQRLRNALPDSNSAGVLPAITLGFRSDMVAGLWDVFRATGTSHLMAISGLHVGIIAGLAYLAARSLARLCGRFLPGARPRRWGALCATLAAWCFAAMAGLSLPTVRAAGMITVLALAYLTRVHQRVDVALALVLITSLGHHPAAVTGAGLWLSYGAVALLITQRQLPQNMNQRRLSVSGMRRRFADQLLLQFRLGAGLLLPTMLFVGVVAWSAPFINLFAIPYFSLLVLPSALFGLLAVVIAPVYAAHLLSASVLLVDNMLNVLVWTAEYAVPWSFGASDTLRLLLCATGLLLLFMPPPVRNMKLVCVLLAFALARPTTHPWEQLHLHVLDVGQGTAVLLRSGERAALIDAGPAWPGGDAGSAHIVPALRYLGIRELDFILLSHADNDHAGGLPSVLKGFPVGRLIGPPMLHETGHQADICSNTMQWRWPQVDFQIIHPASHRGWRRNDASCVLQIRFGQHRVLLPGDIEAPAEAVLAARTHRESQSVLLVPHHGSLTSSTMRFVEHYKPKIAIVTSGFMNRWNFPAIEVVDRWRTHTKCLLNTATNGAIHVRLSAAHSEPEFAAESVSRKRPWVARGARLTANCEEFSTL